MPINYDSRGGMPKQKTHGWKWGRLWGWLIKPAYTPSVFENLQD